MPDPHIDFDAFAADASWSATVAAWGWEQLSDGGFRKSGPCPRCGHALIVEATPGMVANVLPTARRDVLARCHCSGAHGGHPDRPGRDWGCGWRALVPGP